jgi:hypothetical protein
MENGGNKTVKRYRATIVRVYVSLWLYTGFATSIGHIHCLRLKILAEESFRNSTGASPRKAEVLWICKEQQEGDKSERESKIAQKSDTKE